MSIDFRPDYRSKAGQVLEVFEQADADILIRMLYFCSEEPKTESQIMLYCNIDRLKLARFARHCIARRLLKIAPSDDGLFPLVATERGIEVLSTAQDIMQGLGIKLG